MILYRLIAFVFLIEMTKNHTRYCKSIGCSSLVHGHADFCHLCILADLADISPQQEDEVSDADPFGKSKHSPGTKANVDNESTFPEITPPKETDPNGKTLNSPGAKADAGKPWPRLVHGGFPYANGVLVDIATSGAKKYTPNGWTEVPNATDRYTDALLRHLQSHMAGELVDPESGQPHLGHVMWNAAALLEIGGIEVGGPTGLLKNERPWGCVDSQGYYVVRYLNKKRYIHRMVYELLHGPIPEGYTVDHIDRDKLNNSPDNLRLADMSEQMQNTKCYSTNKSGVKGLSWDARRKKWRGAILLKGKQHGYSSEDREAVERWLYMTYQALHPNHAQAAIDS